MHMHIGYVSTLLLTHIWGGVNPLIHGARKHGRASTGLCARRVRACAGAAESLPRNTTYTYIHTMIASVRERVATSMPCIYTCIHVHAYARKYTHAYVTCNYAHNGILYLLFVFGGETIPFMIYGVCSKTIMFMFTSGAASRVALLGLTRDANTHRAHIYICDYMPTMYFYLLFGEIEIRFYVVQQNGVRVFAVVQRAVLAAATVYTHT